MKFTLKALAAAVTMSLAAPGAYAAIAAGGGNAGNGELFFSAWDPISNNGYVRDLGVLMNDFTPTSAAASTTLTFTADSAWSSFIGSVATGDRAGIQYNVAAGENVQERRLMITSTDPAQVGLAQSDTGDVRQAVTNVNAFINTFINTLGTHVGNVVADNGTLHYTPSDPPAAAPGGVSWGEFAAGSLLFKTSASIGSSTLFWMLTAPSAGTATAAAGITQYTAGGPSTWTLGTDGTLIYAPVPEPAEFALMGLGIAALGWYSRRRKKATV